MPESKTEAACRKFQEILSSCAGGFIDAVTFSAAGTRDYLDVKLFQTPRWEVVTILFEDVLHFSMSKGTDLEGAFVDEISVSYLPRNDQPWPPGPEKLVPRFDGLPQLYWVRIIGPAMLTVIAPIMNVTVPQELPRT
ncbi:hypothetical protein ACFY19_00180 [Streptosporangium saharense]|uniref:hypothetical protein n=1 Tax=Streptosporangium saharense TaxID=1706840 RepID=UPI0036BB1749